MLLRIFMAGLFKITISVALFPLHSFPLIHSNSRKSHLLPNFVGDFAIFYSTQYLAHLKQIHFSLISDFQPAQFFTRPWTPIGINCLLIVRYRPGNPLLNEGATTSSQSSTSNEHGIIIGAVVGSVLVVAFVTGIVFYFFRRAEHSKPSASQKGSHGDPFTTIPNH